MGRIDVAIPIRRTGIERLSSKLPPLSRLLTALGWALTIDRATRTSIVQSITQKVHYFLCTLLPLRNHTSRASDFRESRWSRRQTMGGRMGARLIGFLAVTALSTIAGCGKKDNYGATDTSAARGASAAAATTDTSARANAAA